MSIGAIMNNSISGLNATQAALRTTSNNITNVNTEGYQRQIVEISSRVNGGQGAGVEISEIKRLTDIFLAKQVRNALGDTERYDAMSDLHDRFQAILGSPQDNNSLAGRMDQVFEAFGTLPIEPDSLVRRTAAVNDLKAFADSMTVMASQIQLLRGEADRQVGDAIQIVNTQLTRISDLNQQIQKVQLETGTGAADLLNQRDQALSTLSEYMDIETFTFGNGEIGVTTAGGTVLVDQLARQLEYVTPGTVTSTSRFSQISVNKVDAVSGVLTSTGETLDAGLTSGRIKGLIEMRDEILPNFASELGEFSAKVADQINLVHNDNVAVPPPSVLTGINTGLIGTDTTGFTGKVTFVTTDASNNLVNRLEVDFTNNTISKNGAAASAATLTTINDVVTVVNAQMGTATLAFNNGVMEMTAPTGSTGVSMLQDTTSPSDRGGRGFSHFFGMNNLMEANVPFHQDTGLTTASAHGFGTSGIANLELRGPQNQIAKSFSLDFASVGGTAMSDVLTSLNASTAFGNFTTFSLDSAGKLISTPKTGFENYNFNVIGDTTLRGGTKQSISDFFGIGPKFEANTAMDLKVKDSILTDPLKLALAKVDLSADAIAGTVPAITAGDGRGAVEFQKLAEKTITFKGAGHLAGVSTTLGSYAGAVLSDMATQAAIAESIKDDRAALSGELEARLIGESGVNLDEELANMILYQNAYNGAARLITTAREMFDTLLRIAG
ncbi:MAG: flagellar hook-associated protein FlgK [Alphaproteobacteria bacterium]|jgi:flagellar hook-associated protein 1|nr:flagellar hook-associated protein FlgK [Alphaproteobacteria bacterium]MBT4086759.1 flagellar hook-associated protein FlgK [Alphaproteobacteria bacterium]MBT4545065.1 flagellar hook-associated protein FlgK [Alphaproteobacteria bacterium]MBT7746339.1 flagellar hook-associated protein FlgK [Alphaproteobacteria bacterium]